jgi:hypothetical protein
VRAVATARGISEPHAQVDSVDCLPGWVRFSEKCRQKNTFDSKRNPALATRQNFSDGAALLRTQVRSAFGGISLNNEENSPHFQTACIEVG